MRSFHLTDPVLHNFSFELIPKSRQTNLGDYEVLGPVTAGCGDRIVLTPKHVIRITTGAPLPIGADSVVQVVPLPSVSRLLIHQFRSQFQVEDTELLEVTPDGLEEKKIRTLVSVTSGFDVRRKGADIAEVKQFQTFDHVTQITEITERSSIAIRNISRSCRGSNTMFNHNLASKYDVT